MNEPQIHVVTLMLCDLCLDGKGGECRHTPGCALWVRAPDLPLRNHPCLLSIDGQPGQAHQKPGRKIKPLTEGSGSKLLEELMEKDELEALYQNFKGRLQRELGI